jgi:hypothetical protein
MAIDFESQLPGKSKVASFGQPVEKDVSIPMIMAKYILINNN